ncbi:MAG: diguanylate cyclase domain-containing protein [Deltaproteobacteria bacterium]
MPPDLREHDERERSLRLMAAIVDSSGDAIFSQNWDGAITSWNHGAEQMFGYSSAQALGQSETIIVPPEYENELSQIRGKIRRGERIENFEAVRWTKFGRRICVSISVSPVRNESGVLIGVANIVRDITARKEAEARILHLAYFDALTELPNRTLFQDRLQQAVALAKRQNRLLAVHFLDLDHFKNVNDSLGHLQGDALLRAVAERLQRSIRASDTVARFSGDEFAVLQTDLAHAEGAATLAGRLLAVISEPYLINQQTVRTTASIGIAIYPLDDASGSQLVQNADRAMYQAKKSGRNDFWFYGEETET